MPRSKETLPEDPWEMDTGNSRGPNPNYYTGPLVFGMMQNPIVISDSYTSDYHPLSKSWDQHQETGSFDSLCGASDHSNWRIDTPPVPNLNEVPPVNPKAVPQTDPYYEHLGEPYWRVYNAHTAMLRGTRNPPPMYGYETAIPVSTYEWLDRSLKENEELKEKIEKTKRDAKKKAQRMKCITSELERITKNLRDYQIQIILP